ncbi:MAG TPA: hypothetical protein VHV99_26400, partial [Paraburkholderia sp.]|nr:hypothetical protein [Paraburkholderia sp.]
MCDASILTPDAKIGAVPGLAPTPYSFQDDCRGLRIPSIVKANHSMPTVAIAIFPGVQALDVAGPV